MENFSVTFVIGAANESDALKQTVKKIIGACHSEDIAKILLVYSPHSPKECVSAIREIQADYPGTVLGLKQTRQYVGGAIQDGFDKAHSSHIMLLPGDLAVDLNAVPLLIEKEKNNPTGIVKVSRWLKKGAFHGYPPVKKFLNATAQVFLRCLYQTDLTDMTNPVQIMPTSLYRQIDWKELNFPFLIELVLCPLRLGIDITEISTACFGRTQGKSNNSFWQTALYLKTALRVRFTKPEKLLKQTERKNK